MLVQEMDRDPDRQQEQRGCDAMKEQDPDVLRQQAHWSDEPLVCQLMPRFWLNLQSEYDIRVADRELRAKLSPRIRVFQPAVA